MIPYWFISMLAFVAAGCLWLVRPLPWLVRISIIVPILYVAILYGILANVSALDHSLRVDITRLGIVMLMISIIVNSIMVRIAWWKGGKYL